MKRGTQVIYIPRHVKQEDVLKFNYPYATQPGFVFGDGNMYGCKFVRYWIVEDGKPMNELRTKANSEQTPEDCLFEMDTVPQSWVDQAIAWIEYEAKKGW